MDSSSHIRANSANVTIENRTTASILHGVANPLHLSIAMEHLKESAEVPIADVCAALYRLYHMVVAHPESAL